MIAITGKVPTGELCTRGSVLWKELSMVLKCMKALKYFTPRGGCNEGSSVGDECGEEIKLIPRISRGK